MNDPKKCVTISHYAFPLHWLQYIFSFFIGEKATKAEKTL